MNLKIPSKIIKFTTMMLLSFVVSLSINAQDVESTSSSSTKSAGDFSFGAKGLVQATKYQDSKLGAGFGIGGFAAYQIFDFLSVQGEVMYVESSGKFDDMTEASAYFDSTTYSNRVLRFQMVEIPVIVRYDLPFGGLNVYAGGSYSYNIAVSEITDKTHFYNDGESSDFKNVRKDVSSQYESYNAEAVIGIGMSLELFGLPSHIDLRYKQGFINQARLIPLDGSSSDFKSRSLSINLGISIF